VLLLLINERRDQLQPWHCQAHLVAMNDNCKLLILFSILSPTQFCLRTSLFFNQAKDKPEDLFAAWGLIWEGEEML